MKKEIASALMLTLIVTSLLTFAIQPGKSEPTVIVVPDDYPTIQEAINHANEGDMINVRAGTYHESVVVDKTVSLLGENRDSTIIDSGGTGYGVYIAANDVLVSGFRIQNGWNGIWVYVLTSGITITDNVITNNSEEAIRLSSSENNHIMGNDITNSWYGIRMYRSHNNEITENHIADNDHGLELGESQGNTVVSNSITNHVVGLRLWEAYGNTLLHNNLADNTAYGIRLEYSGGNVVAYNTLLNNGNGVSLSASFGNLFIHNDFHSNTRQVESVLSSVNTWDDGYPAGGNYWSDYEARYPDAEEIDDSGLWDTPYVIDADNHDAFPLMTPWSPTPPPPILTATVDINPDILNTKCRGRWITVYVELEEGYSVEGIDVSTILLDDLIAVDLDAPTEIGDYDSDGIPDLMVKFNRASVIAYIMDKMEWSTLIVRPRARPPLIREVALTITGLLHDGTLFQGSYTIVALKFSRRQPIPI